MKLAIISDSHGHVEAIRQVLVQMGKVDALIHLGDGIADMQRLSLPAGVATYHVRGNNDFTVPAPSTQYRLFDDQRVMLTHGHELGVKMGLNQLEYAAQEHQCKLACFGHTHIAYLDEQGPVILLNPGSVGASFHPSFALVDISRYGIFCRIVPLSF